MLQHAVEQFLRDRGWTVVADGRTLAAERDGEEAFLGFLGRGDAPGFVDRCAESSAAQGAILVEPVPDGEVEDLEEAGIACFSREEIEDVVMTAWFKREGLDASPFVRFLEGD